MELFSIRIRRTFQLVSTLNQYYSVFRIYREELKNRPAELYNVLTELGLRLETDYMRLHVPRP